MEPIFVYAIKSTALISIFYLVYLLLLQHETFFKSNRFFLLLGILLSLFLPLSSIKKTISVEVLATPASVVNAANNITLSPKNLPNPKIEIENSEAALNWLLIITIVYVLVLCILFLKFLIELYYVSKVIKSTKPDKIAATSFYNSDKNVNPFSFFNYIVANKDLYSQAELLDILSHEKVHCSQLHSVDIIFARLFSIVFWFNPIVWLYKKAIVQNLEFLADAEAVTNVSDRKKYQLTLLKVTTQHNCAAISNHFYQPCLPAGRSLIKKRIVMLNKNQSKIWQFWKYALVFPILIAFIIQFQTKVVAQEYISDTTIEVNSVLVNKNSTDAELLEESKRFEKNSGGTLKFFDIKRNLDKEIVEISGSFYDVNVNLTDYNQKSSTAIDDFYFEHRKHQNGKIEVSFENSKTTKYTLTPVVPIPPSINVSNNPLPPPLPKLNVSTTKIKNQKKLVVIDAGHGGNDPGATADGVVEKQITANIAKKIKQLSKNSEVTVILTRDSDKFVSLQDRADKINALQPDLVISLHVNASNDASKNGVEAYHDYKSPFYKESLKKSFMIFTQLNQNYFDKFSIDNAGFFIFKKIACPAVQLELGYITNEKDRNYISSEKGQTEIANNIFNYLKI